MLIDQQSRLGAELSRVRSKSMLHARRREEHEALRKHQAVTAVTGQVATDALAKERRREMVRPPRPRPGGAASLGASSSTGAVAKGGCCVAASASRPCVQHGREPQKLGGAHTRCMSKGWGLGGKGATDGSAHTCSLSTPNCVPRRPHSEHAKNSASPSLRPTSSASASAFPGSSPSSRRRMRRRSGISTGSRVLGQARCQSWRRLVGSHSAAGQCRPAL